MSVCVLIVCGQCICLGSTMCACVYIHTCIYMCVCLCVSVSISNMYIGMEWTEYMCRIDWVIPSGCAMHTVHVCLHTCMYASVRLYVSMETLCVCPCVCLWNGQCIYVGSTMRVCVCIRVRCVYIRDDMCECVDCVCISVCVEWPACNTNTLAHSTLLKIHSQNREPVITLN